MLANRVREYSTTTGTGDITLTGAMAGHARFADGFSVGDSVIYVLEDGANYEIGTGRLSGENTLERTQVQETLQDGELKKGEDATPISLSGQARVYCAATAEFLTRRPEITTDIIREVTPGAGVTIGDKLKAHAIDVKSSGPGLMSFALENSGNVNDLVQLLENSASGGEIRLQNSAGVTRIVLDGASGKLTAVAYEHPSLQMGANSGRSWFAPIIDGSPNFNREFGYDPTPNHWYFETDVNISGGLTATGIESRDNGANIVGSPTLAPTIQFQDSAGNSRGIIQYQGINALFANSINGGGIVFRGDNNAGTATNLLTADPDGVVELYRAGSLALSTQANGITVTGPTSSVSQVLLRANDGTTNGFLSTSSGGFFLRNSRPGISVQLEGTNSGGTTTTLFDGDPNGVVELHYAGIRAINTEPFGMSIRHTNANSPAFRMLGFDGGNRVTVQSETSGAFVITNEINGAPIVLRGRNNAGTLASIINGDPDEGVRLFFQGRSSVHAIDGGVLARGSTTASPLVRLDGFDDVTRASISAPPSGLLIDSELDGMPITLQGANSGGTTRLLAVLDPDGGAGLFHAGLRVLDTATNGARILDQDGDTVHPTLTFATGTGSVQGFIQLGNSGSLLRSTVHGAPVALQGEDVGGVVRDIVRGDPDGATSLNHAGTERFATTTTGAVTRGLLAVQRSGELAGAPAAFAGTGIRVEQANAALNSNIEIISERTRQASLLFGDQDSAGAGSIVYDNATNTMGFGVGGVANIFSVNSAGIQLGQSAITRSVANGTVALSGGTQTYNGGNIVLFGQSHTMQAFDILFRTDATIRLQWDHSALAWNYHGNNLTAVGDITLSGDEIRRSGNSANLSITGGNAYNNGGEVNLFGGDHPTRGADISFVSDGTQRLNWDNSALNWNFNNTILSNIPQIVKGTAANTLRLSGGSNYQVGGNIVLYGESHATQANDILFRAGTSEVLHYDYSAGLFDFKSNKLVGLGDLTLSSSLITRNIRNSAMFVSGGNAAGDGGNIILYGGDHATSANNTVFRANGTPWLSHDASDGDINCTPTNRFVVHGILRAERSNFTRLELANIGGNTFFIANDSGNLLFSNVTAGNVLVRISGSAPADSLVIDSGGNTRIGGGLTVGDGTNTAPSFSFASDPNSGMYRITENEVGIATGSALQLRITGTEIDCINNNITTTGDLTVGGTVSLGSADLLDIASGEITITKSFHTIDTEGNAATDDLDTIIGGSEGDTLILQIADNARQVTLRDGAGNLQLNGNFTLQFRSHKIMLIRHATGQWHEISRSSN